MRTPSSDTALRLDIKPEDSKYCFKLLQITLMSSQHESTEKEVERERISGPTQVKPIKPRSTRNN